MPVIGVGAGSLVIGAGFIRREGLGIAGGGVAATGGTSTAGRDVSSLDLPTNHLADAA